MLQLRASAGRVLSIQSSVVHGYVGNKAAVFPLQLLGFDVDPVHSVQLSNHTGYPVVKGHVFDGQHLAQLVEGLAANGLLCHSHLLTGYINSVSLLEAVADVARALRRANPGLTFVCDPVLGDEGKLYVSEELLAAYKATLVPLADVLVPNQYEAQLLTGLGVADEAGALAAAAALHDVGPHTVIITSLSLLPHPEYDAPPDDSGVTPPGAGSAPPPAPPAQQQAGKQQPPLEDKQQQQQSADQQQQQQQQQQRGAGGQHVTLVASTRLPQQPGCPQAFCLRIPKLPGYFTGTGDLLAALLLARIHEAPGNLAAAVEAAVGSLQGVLTATSAAAAADAEGGAEHAAGTTMENSSAAAFKARELRLVQAQGCILNPDISIRAVPQAAAKP